MGREDYTVPKESVPPSALKTLVYTIAVSGVKETVGNFDCRNVMVIADDANAATVYICGLAENANDIPLAPGDSVGFSVVNVNRFGVRGQAGDKIRILAEV